MIEPFFADSILATLARHGFRKASMEDLARSAGVSRQSLYNRFGSKAALADWATTALIDTSLAQAFGHLANPQHTLVARLSGALDAWIGRHTDLLHSSPHAFEIVVMAGPAPTDAARAAERKLVAAMAEAIRRSGPGSAAPRAGSMAQALAWAARGLVHGLPDHAAYRREMDHIVGAILGR